MKQRRAAVLVAVLMVMTTIGEQPTLVGMKRTMVLAGMATQREDVALIRVPTTAEQVVVDADGPSSALSTCSQTV
jgi:hypothetical protein